MCRLTVAICSELCSLHPAGEKMTGVRLSRWAAILQDYSRIRQATNSLFGKCVQPTFRISWNEGFLLMINVDLRLFLKCLVSWRHNSLVRWKKRAVFSVDIPLPSLTNSLAHRVEEGGSWRSGQDTGSPIPARRSHRHYMCKQCGQPEKQEFGERRLTKIFLCEKAEGKKYELRHVNLMLFTIFFSDSYIV